VGAVLAGLILAMSSVAARAEGTDPHTFIDAEDIKWGDAPPSLPKGAKLAVLHGDPGKAGPFVIRLMVPPGYRIPPHWHSQPEQLTVISGTFELGLGDTVDLHKLHGLTAGGYHYLPANAHHYPMATGRTLVQLTANGPFDIMYINPADDPQKSK